MILLQELLNGALIGSDMLWKGIRKAGKMKTKGK